MSPEPILTTSFNNSEKATLLIGFVLGLFFLRNVGTKAAILLELMGQNPPTTVLTHCFILKKKKETPPAQQAHQKPPVKDGN